MKYMGNIPGNIGKSLFLCNNEAKLIPKYDKGKPFRKDGTQSQESKVFHTMIVRLPYRFSDGSLLSFWRKECWDFLQDWNSLPELGNMIVQKKSGQPKAHVKECFL